MKILSSFPFVVAGDARTSAAVEFGHKKRAIMRWHDDTGPIETEKLMAFHSAKRSAARDVKAEAKKLAEKAHAEASARYGAV